MVNELLDALLRTRGKRRGMRPKRDWVSVLGTGTGFGFLSQALPLELAENKSSFLDEIMKAVNIHRSFLDLRASHHNC
ncbi:hypothetical protein PanWU01x14_216990 [Parasponia andersonii]|uniref:Uncharacterized protein n=1 Tax=Parasponia andersonii TaxID=3476 RepID=A0A2P5BRB9_PARAD|nr:hypothetical protein PanWU01x14_216990 [Parasponia andersonii]